MHDELFACVPIMFSRLVSAEELTVAVQSLSDADTDDMYKPSFRTTVSHDGSFMIGQASGYPSDHLVVAPSRELLTFYPGQEVDRVVVMNYAWRENIFAIGETAENYARTVNEYVQRLRQYFIDLP